MSSNFTIVSLKFPGKREQAPTCGYCQYPTAKLYPSVPLSSFQMEADVWAVEQTGGAEAFLGSCANVTGPRRARPGCGRFAQGPVHTGPCRGLPAPGKCNHRKAKGKPISPKFLQSQRAHPQLSGQHFRYWRGEALPLKH